MVGKPLKKNNPTIALNILYIKEKEICPACIWKIRIVKNIILLIIPNEKKTRMALYSSEKTIYIIKRNNTESLIKSNSKACRAYSFPKYNASNLGIWLRRKQTYFISWKRPYEKILLVLREHGKNKIDFEKKKMLPLTKEELKSHQVADVCYICGKRILQAL